MRVHQCKNCKILFFVRIWKKLLQAWYLTSHFISPFLCVFYDREVTNCTIEPCWEDINSLLWKWAFNILQIPRTYLSLELQDQKNLAINVNHNYCTINTDPTAYFKFFKVRLKVWEKLQMCLKTDFKAKIFSESGS